MLTGKIEHIRIQNYKSLAEVDVNLEDLTILVGANASGKSNFIDALRLVRDALSNGLDREIDQRGSIGSLRTRLSKPNLGDISIELDLTINSEQAHYGFVLHSARENDYVVKREVCRFGSEEYEFEEGTLVHTSNTSLKLEPIVGEKALALPLIRNARDSRQELLYDFLVKMRFFAILPEKLGEPQRRLNPSPLQESGENLARVLENIVTNESETWRRDALYEGLADIVPGVVRDDAISVAAAGDYLVINVSHENNRKFPLGIESDGTRRAIALLASIYQNYPFSLLAIEEPELMLHPHAAGVLTDNLNAASLRSQILFTTHSPDLIARFKADSLRIVEMVQGITQIGPLRDDQRQAINDQLFNGGDLLRIEGLKRD